MESRHGVGMVDVAFDEANLLADAGLVQVVALAEHPGHLNRPAARSLSTAEPVTDTVNNVVSPRATARSPPSPSSPRSATACSTSSRSP
jgi:hypothetical protein